MSKSLKLLYVEDVAAIREATLSVLSNFFDTIFVGVDGQDGLECYQAHAHEIDLILTDITMPRKNGIEMIEAIRELSQNIPILVISAHTEFRYFVQTIESGVDGYLLKPLKLEQLIKILSKTIVKIHLAKEHAKNLLLLKQYESITNKSSIISKTKPRGIIT